MSVNLSSIHLPFVSLELGRFVSNSSSASLPVKVLIIGQGTVSEAGIFYAPTLDTVSQIAGQESHIWATCKEYFKKPYGLDTYIGVLPDVDSEKSVATIAITGTPTESGTLYIRLNGDILEIPIVTTDTVAMINAKIVAAINELPRYERASIKTETVEIAPGNGGASVEELLVEVCADPGQKIPAGLTVAVTVDAAAGADPDIMGVLNKMKDIHFTHIISPYASATTLEKVAAFLKDRADYYNHKDALYITLQRDTVANLITNNDYNSQFLALGDATNWRSPNFKILGVLGREVANSTAADVNLPLHNLPLDGLVPPLDEDIREWNDRNILASKGVFTFDPESVMLEAPVTTRLKTDTGEVDKDNRRWENIFNVADLRYSFIHWILARYERAKLLRTNQKVRAGIKIINPDIGKAEAVAWYKTKCKEAQVENAKGVAKLIRCDIDSKNTNALVWYIPAELVKQFVVGGGEMAYTTGEVA